MGDEHGPIGPAGRLEVRLERLMTKLEGVESQLSATRQDLRERIESVRTDLHARQGDLEQQMGRLEAGKAAKWVETALAAVLSLIVLTFLGALLATVINRPALPAIEAMPGMGGLP